jgi:hypothetical protein
MNLVINFLFSLVLINASAIDELINKYTNNTNFTITNDIEQTIREKIKTSISKSLNKISNDTKFMSQYEQNKDIIEGLYSQLKQFNTSNNLLDLEHIITSYQLLNELNISEDSVKINKMLESMKKIVNYLKENKVDLRLPDLSNYLKEDYFKEDEAEDTKPEICTMDQCLLDGKCVSKIYCDRLAKKDNKSNVTFYAIISIIAFLMVLFILYKIKNRVTNNHIEYIPQNKEEDGSISYS